MEYIIGSFSTLGILICLYFIINKLIDKYAYPKIRYRQSNVHNIIAPFLSEITIPKKVKDTQSILHDRKNSIRVIMIDGSAYWIKDNTFYTAYVDPHGTVDKDTTRVVDIMSLSSVELDKMLFIMDKLREGLNNDSGSTGQ